MKIKGIERAADDIQAFLLNMSEGIFIAVTKDLRKEGDL